jgi:hypothetical protein
VCLFVCICLCVCLSVFADVLVCICFLVCSCFCLCVVYVFVSVFVSVFVCVFVYVFVSVFVSAFVYVFAFLISARISQPIRHFLDDVFSFFYFSFSFEEQKYLRHFNLLSRSTVDLRHAIKKKFLSKLSTFTSNFGLSHFISNLSFIFYFRCLNSPLTETAIYCF